jgi:hypothetical protein
MQVLADRYTPAFLSALHRENAAGLRGLQRTLDRFAPGVTSLQVIHDWLATTALDRVLDEGATLAGGRPRRAYTAKSLSHAVWWSTPEAYNTPGAPPNGADFVRLRDAHGRFLTADDLRTVGFEGARTLPAAPVQWAVDHNPPGRGRNPALYSGTGNTLDRSIVRPVAVPAGHPTLSVETKWSTEAGFDSGFVQVSTDGGKTYTSLGNADTTTDLDPGADPALKENVPGFNGEGGWTSEVFDLSRYAGRTVLLAFRYISDANTNGRGWWIDKVRVNGTLLSDGSSLSGWRTRTQVRPTPVAGFTVQLVAIREDGSRVWVSELPLTSAFTGTFGTRQLRRRLGGSAGLVGALVTYDDPREQTTQYARYTLTANGVVQPGG